jgi:hypothetical protein
VRDRRPGLRTDRLDPDARPRRHRRWEPKRLHPRLFSIADRLVRGCASHRAGHGPRRSPPRSPACRPSRPADQQTTTRNEHTRDPWDLAHPARQSGSQAQPHAEKRPRASASAHQITDAKDRG